MNNTTNDELSLNKRMSHDNIKDRRTNNTEIDKDTNNIDTELHVFAWDSSVFHDQSKDIHIHRTTQKTDKYHGDKLKPQWHERSWIQNLKQKEYEVTGLK